MTDPIADLLTRIRNANLAYLEYADIPASKFKEQIVKVMKDAGFILDYKLIESGNQKVLRVYLKYEGKLRAINGLVRVSKPGCRIYANVRNLPKPPEGAGISIISTPKGVLTDEQCKSMRVGGEVLCYIW